MATPTGRLRAFGAFWWDFIVGDDWRIAAGVVAAFVVTAVLAHNDIAAWWVTPLAALGMLAASLAQVVRTARRQ
jgi:hypothetical protein